MTEIPMNILFDMAFCLIGNLVIAFIGMVMLMGIVSLFDRSK